MASDWNSMVAEKTADEERKLQETRTEESNFETCETNDLDKWNNDFFWNEEESKHLAMAGWVFEKKEYESYGESKDGYTLTRTGDNEYEVKEKFKSNGGKTIYIYKRDKSKIRDRERLKQLEDELDDMRAQLKNLSKVSPMMTTLRGHLYLQRDSFLLLVIMCLPIWIAIMIKKYIDYKKFNQVHAEDIRLINEYNKRVAEIEKEIAEITDFSGCKEKEAERRKKIYTARAIGMAVLYVALIALNIYSYGCGIAGFF